MKPTHTWWRTNFSLDIEPVQVCRENRKTVVVEVEEGKEVRFHKISDSLCYHPTWHGAREFLLRHFRDQADRAATERKRALGLIDATVDLQSPNAREFDDHVFPHQEELIE